ncbi:cation diffusion facilitator family transporter [Shouchella sp. 1P09AA]|uniref:cation diffusion facilitator family transporter n=1 Tax=unclassified Shouchella TaxID=2893065 RepID=UPI0039A3B1FC
MQSHQDASNHTNKKNLIIAMIIIGSWMFIQLIGGLWTGSLALLADAVHMLNDFANLGISLIALIIARKAASKHRTFGNYRYEILSSVLNSLALLVISFFILKEAIARITDPQPVLGGYMIIIAFIGLIANLAAIYVLVKSDVKGNLNMRGAYLHVLSDTLGSVVAVGAGIIILLTGWYLADPILSILIAILILISAIRLLKDTLHVLMEAVPREINIDEVKLRLKDFNEVIDVDNLHIWSLTSGINGMNVQLFVSKQVTIYKQINLKQEVRQYVRENLNVTFLTIEIEFVDL